MPDSLQIALKNDSDSSSLFAFVTGIAIQNGQRCLLKTDGRSLYYPQNPPAIGSPLTEDCAIPLGPPGNTVTVQIPQIAGGRIWISDGPLHFLLNPGPALVEPSVLNPTDPNANIDFGFCEFTLNDAQLYANISYVDFVPRIPIALTLQQASGQIQHVTGMASDGLETLASKLREQSQRDHQPWDKLIVSHQNRTLRILNATHGPAVGADFANYFEPYVDQVWAKYAAPGPHVLHIDTQAAPGVLRGQVDPSDQQLRIGAEKFGRPSTADILGCDSGPFATAASSPTRNAIIPRLAAAFVRSTLLHTAHHPSHPSGDAGAFYGAEHPTNHYARCVHEVNVDGKGYAFAYDDVGPEGGEDQSGKVNAGDPVLFTVAVGGKGVRVPETGDQTERGREGYTRGPPPPPPPSGGYDRGPPPPPPGVQQQEQQQRGWRDRVKGLAERFAH